jgi:formyl-CoA transferase
MASSYCGLLLSLMGAEVVKVGARAAGDDLRRNQTLTGGAFRPDAVSHGKRSLAVDPARPARRRRTAAARGPGRRLRRELPAGHARASGVSPDALRARNPRLVTCSITGFRASGPEADQPGFDLVTQGMAGIMSLTGEPGRPPVVAGVPISDLNAGSFAAMGILSALLERERTGQGQHVDTSLFERRWPTRCGNPPPGSTQGRCRGRPAPRTGSGSPYAAFPPPTAT